MRVSRWHIIGGVVVLALLALSAYEWKRFSCHGLLPFSGWVLDEATCAGRSWKTFPAAGIKLDDVDERAYFAKMDRGALSPEDGGIKLSPEESAGRIMWMLWTGGNDRFWDETVKHSLGSLDFLKTLSSHEKAGYCKEPKADPGKYKRPSETEDSADLNEAYWVLNKVDCKVAGGKWEALSRDNRWKYYGLVNEPCFEKPTKPDEFGLWLDKRVPPSDDCPDDPFEDETKYPGLEIGARGKSVFVKGKERRLPVGSYYGKASGVLGLRLFPNPDFDEEARKKWDGEKFYTEPSYYKNKDLIRPYRVGVSCAFCHVSPDPLNPPKNPEKPKWENLSNTVGSQYLWLDRAFLWNPQDHTNFFYQLLRTGRPGTFDTSLVSSDNINNPRTMNAVYGTVPRLRAAKHWGKETMAGGGLDNRQFNDFAELFIDGISTHDFFKPWDPKRDRPPRDTATVWNPRILKDGSDGAGVLAALNRVYLNIGVFSEEWLQHFTSFIGPLPWKPITPIKVADAQRNSEYWKATEAQSIYMAQFLVKADKPHYLKDADKDGDPQTGKTGQDYLVQDEDFLNEGKDAFADYCARCHSSKIPQPAVGLDDSDCSFGKDYRKCWNKYWDWTKSKGFKEKMRELVREDDFLENNYLSTDVRVPVTLLETNVCSALATNAIEGDIWDNFSSQSYKDLPSVGSVEVFPAWSDDGESFNPFAPEETSEVKTHTYDMPAGGRGYIRPPSLISLWSTAPFLLNNSLGKFEYDPSVETRIASFNDSIEQLLWPEKRDRDQIKWPDKTGRGYPPTPRGAGLIDRTTVQSYLKIPVSYFPSWIPSIFRPTQDVEIGPIPADTPVNLLANLEVSAANLSLVLRAKEKLEKLPLPASDEQLKKAFIPLIPDLLRASKCPDFVVNKGHYFGTEFFEGEEPLDEQKKRALIEFLKTF